VLTVPAALASSPLSVKIVHDDSSVQRTESSSVVRGQAVLVLSISVAEKGGKSVANNSSLLAVPYTVPVQSTLAVAMGKGVATKVWVKDASSEAAGEGKREKGDEEKEKVLASVRAAMEAGKHKTAESAFAEWLKNAEAKAEDDASLLDYNFVKEVLDVVLPYQATAMYPGEIVKALLGRKGAVSSSMVQGGLLPALRDRGDWVR